METNLGSGGDHCIQPMELMDRPEGLTSESEDSSESEFSETLGDGDSDDSSSSSSDGGGYTTDCTTDSDSCNTFLDGVEKDLLESFHRDQKGNALARREATQRSASLSALDMLQNAADAEALDDSSQCQPVANNQRRTLARQRSARAIMDRMNSSKCFYFQDPNTAISTDPSTIERAASTIAKGELPFRNTTGDKSRDLSPRRTNRSMSTGALDESTKTIDYGQSPETCLRDVLQGLKYLPASDEYFLDINATRLNRYSAEVARAVRAQDIAKLHQLHDSGVSFDACNSQGESLVHLACRRRNAELLNFLINEANVSLKVRDDWGKSPLHEMAWNGRPKEGDFFPAVKLILEKEPELLFAKDKRGSSPLQYVPKDSWNEWCHFLKASKVWIRCKVQYIGFARSRDQLKKTLELAEAALGQYAQ